MNRPPPPPGPGGPWPDVPWHQRHPTPEDRTGVARRPPRAADPAPPSPAARPPFVNAPQRPRDIPWYLQRPDRTSSATPPPERPQPAPPQQSNASIDIKKLLPWLLLGTAGVAAVIAAVALVGIVSRLGVTGDAVLDVTTVQDGVSQTLSNPASGYGANTVTDVSCNDGRNPSARQGTTFTCTATVNGSARHVTVFVSDDHGTYEIDSPR